jgi:hypothetical protein
MEIIVTPETRPDVQADIRWFETTYATELAELRARMIGLSDQDQVTFLLARCLRLQHELGCVTAALASIETSARDIARLAKLTRPARGEFAQ